MEEGSGDSERYMIIIESEITSNNEEAKQRFTATLNLGDQRTKRAVRQIIEVDRTSVGLARGLCTVKPHIRLLVISTSETKGTNRICRAESPAGKEGATNEGGSKK